MTKEGPSGWVWLAWGCGGCLVVAGLVLVGLVVVAYRMGRSVDAQTNDPAARAERARQVLGTEELPDGYLPIVTFSVPLLFETVILADRPLDERESIPEDAERLFVYVELIRGGRAWRQYAEGQGDPSEILSEQGISMRRRDEIGRGELPLDGGGTLDYVAQRGELTVKERDFDGIVTFLLIRCEDARRMRIGVWAGPDPGAGRPVTEVDFRGTHADPEAIRAFVSRFDLCGA